MTAVALLLDVAGMIMVAAAFHPENGPIPLWLVLGILASIGGAWLTVASQRKSSADAADAVTQVADALAEIFNTFTTEETAKGRVFYAMACIRARALVGRPGTRVCVYQLSAEEDEDTDFDMMPVEPPAHSTRLVCDKTEGRGDTAEAILTVDDELGKYAIRAVERAEAVQLIHSAIRRFPDARQSTRAWQSALFVPLIPPEPEARPVGVVRIDSRMPDDFSEADIAIGWAIAKLIGFGMVKAEIEEADTAPEVAQIRALLRALNEGTPQPPGTVGDHK